MIVWTHINFSHQAISWKHFHIKYPKPSQRKSSNTNRFINKLSTINWIQCPLVSGENTIWSRDQMLTIMAIGSIGSEWNIITNRTQDPLGAVWSDWVVYLRISTIFQWSSNTQTNTCNIWWILMIAISCHIKECRMCHGLCLKRNQTIKQYNITNICSIIGWLFY